jgi:hypothetical protein
LKTITKFIDSNCIQNKFVVLLTLLTSYSSVTAQFTGGIGGGGIQHILTGSLGEYTPLPFSLLNFEAFGIAQNTKTSQLDWQVVSQTNTSHYNVEWSADGTAWKKIGNVKSNGNGKDLISYQFIHNEAQVQNFYRLCQVNINGTVIYSNIKSVVFNQNTLAQTVNIYPNPSHNSFNLSTNNESEVLYEITNLSGAVVMSGSFVKHITLDGLTKGLYIVKLSFDNVFELKKLIIN